jgi:hypothetical protein
MLLHGLRLRLRLELELVGRPLPLLRGGDIPLLLLERPVPIGPLLALERPLLRVELGLHLLCRRRWLRDHQNIHERSVLHDRSNIGRDLGLIYDGGSGGSFVSSMFVLGVEWVGVFWEANRRARGGHERPAPCVRGHANEA